MPVSRRKRHSGADQDCRILCNRATEYVHPSCICAECSELQFCKQPALHLLQQSQCDRVRQSGHCTQLFSDTRAGVTTTTTSPSGGSDHTALVLGSVLGGVVLLLLLLALVAAWRLYRRRQARKSGNSAPRVEEAPPEQETADPLLPNGHTQVPDAVHTERERGQTPAQAEAAEDSAGGAGEEAEAGAEHRPQPPQPPQPQPRVAAGTPPGAGKEQIRPVTNATETSEPRRLEDGQRPTNMTEPSILSRVEGEIHWQPVLVLN